MKRLAVSLISTILLTMNLGLSARALVVDPSETRIQFYQGKQSVARPTVDRTPSGQVAYQVLSKQAYPMGIAGWLNQTNALRLPQTGEQITLIYVTTGGLLLAATGLGLGLWRLESEMSRRAKR